MTDGGEESSLSLSDAQLSLSWPSGWGSGSPDLLTSAAYSKRHGPL